MQKATTGLFCAGGALVKLASNCMRWKQTWGGTLTGNRLTARVRFRVRLQRLLITIDSAAALVAGEDLQPAALWPAMWTQRKDIELDGWAAATSGTDGLFACSLLKLYLLVKYPYLTPWWTLFNSCSSSWNRSEGAGTFYGFEEAELFVFIVQKKHNFLPHWRLHCWQVFLFLLSKGCPFMPQVLWSVTTVCLALAPGVFLTYGMWIS